MKHAGKRNHVVKCGTNGNTCCFFFFSHFVYRFRFMLKLAQQLRCIDRHTNMDAIERSKQKGIRTMKKNICELHVSWIFLCGAQKFWQRFFPRFFFRLPFLFTLLITYYYFLSCCKHFCSFFLFLLPPLSECMRCAKVLNTSWDPSPWEMHINKSMANVNTAPNKNG